MSEKRRDSRGRILKTEKVNERMADIYTNILICMAK